MSQVLENVESETMGATLLTELERQERVLSELPDNYEFPLFNGRQAVESQRKSGYKNTPRAAREIVDNGFEAGATEVHVAFRRAGDGGRAKGERKDAVAAIAFIDNGPGMLPEMAHYAMSWGGGTRFENPTGIGRFGFGLPNSRINQSRRTELYTKTADSTGWTKVVLDINGGSVPLHGLATVPTPEEDAELPDWVRDDLKRNKINLQSGTIVVWDKPDRLSARSAGTLKQHMVDDFGVVYRYLLERFRLVIDGTDVEKVDPLFLMPDARYYLSQDDGGPWTALDETLTVKYHRDPDTGTQNLELLTDAADIRAARKDPQVVVENISVRVAGFP